MTGVRPLLSVCSLSASPLARTAAIFDQLSTVADEIICAVDSRVPPSELSELAGHADVVVRCEFDPSFTQERNLAWLYGLCSGKWLFRTDYDEVISGALLAVLPRLIRADDVVQYSIRRRWLYPDVKHALDERPWSDDWQIRLMRNEPFCIRIPGDVHTSVEVVKPCRYVEEPIYHLDCILSPLDEREAKVARYEMIHPGLVRRDGIPMNDNYFPERLQPQRLIDVPEADVDRISEVVDAPKLPRRIGIQGASRSWQVPQSPVPVVGFEEIDRHWALRSVPASAYVARLELLEPLEGMQVDETREVLVRVHNDGTESWPWGDHKPEIRLGQRWLTRDGATVYMDGARTSFLADVPPGASALQKMMVVAPATPGDFQLELNVVHEHVAWFAGALRIPVSVINAQKTG
jgi:hypothetical protein